MSIWFAGTELKNRLAALPSPLTEFQPKLMCCHEAGFGSAILEITAAYTRTGLGMGKNGAVCEVNTGHKPTSTRSPSIYFWQEDLGRRIPRIVIGEMRIALHERRMHI